MKLPQKLGLDVVVDRHTGNLVTLEVNGVFSGYQGLKALGRDLMPDIINIIGTCFENQRILVNPCIHEFYGEAITSGDLKDLKKYYNIDVVYSPLTPKPLPQYLLETVLGSFDRFDGIIGFGEYLTKSNCQSRMINSPAVELLTQNKFLQYHLLKNIPPLNMPETVLIDGFVHLPVTAALVEKYGKLVHKPLDGSQGNGIRIFTNKNFQHYKEFIEEYLESSQEEHKYISYLQTIKSIQLLVEQQMEDKLKSIILSITSLDGKGEENVNRSFHPDAELGQEMEKSYIVLTERHEERESEIDDFLRQRLKNNAVLLQKCVETLPVIAEDTAQPHYACARLIWFGDYLGGYWKLSAKPIDADDERNAIVNYSTAKKAQRFTTEENNIFRRYAKEIVPQILETVEPFETNEKMYKTILFNEFKNSLLRNPKLF
ncbi:MAG: hypothetical protein Q8R37_02840 [Nanoarchaeota archaeon]|nr:hypothetical protein [Nanoarchaeota archaeon]